MGLFKKKNKYKNHLLDYNVDSYPFPKSDNLHEGNSFPKENDNTASITPWDERKKHTHAPHALSPEELLGSSLQQKKDVAKTDVPKKPIQNIEMTPAPSGSNQQPKPESLYERLMNAKTQSVGTEKAYTYKSVQNSNNIEEITKTNNSSSLLSKCKMFIEDDDGNESYVHVKKPRYTLESVDDIINFAENKAKERIAKVYGEIQTDKRPITAEPKSNTEKFNVFISKPEANANKTELKQSEAQKAHSSVNNATTPAPPVKVMPIRKSRFFTTPNGGDHTVAAKSEATEVPVQISVIDMYQDSKTLTGKVVEKSALPNNISTKSEEPQKATTIGSSQNSFSKNYQYSYADNDPPKSTPTRVSDLEKTREININDIKQPVHKANKAPEKTTKFDLSELDEMFESPDKINWEDEFTRTQKDKSKKFVLFGDEEEDNYPDEIPETSSVEVSEEEIDDYNNYDDAQSVSAELSSNKRKLIARMFPTTLITAGLAVMASPLMDFFRESYLSTYLIINIVLLALCALINLNTMKGIAGIFTLNPDMDTPAALATVSVLAHNIIQLSTNSDQSTVQLGALAAMALLFNGIGKLVMISRIQKGFKVIATPEEKHGVFLVENEAAASTISGGAVIGDALICVSRKTTNITHFLKNSYSEEPFERLVPKIILFSSITSIIGGVLAFFFCGGIIPAITLFVAIMCLACPPTSLLLSNVPLKLAADRLKDYDAAITGYEAVETLCEANAIVFDIFDMFPAGTVKLYNMHLLSANPIDRTIQEAAAVAVGAKSPLTDIFDRIIEYDRKSLPSVDSITYEEKLGISGWIGDKRVLIGNRMLMEAHGVKIPAIEVDKKILRSGYFPVYIASGGKPGVLFVVGYEADEEVTYELRRLCSTGVTVLVNSCDPNITAEMLCDYFGLYDESVKIMNSAAVQLYKQETNYQESTNALVAFKGSILGFASGLTACIKLKSLIKLTTALHIIGLCLGISLAGYFTFTDQQSVLTTFTIGSFQLFCTAFTTLIAYIKRP